MTSELEQFFGLRRMHGSPRALELIRESLGSRGWTSWHALAMGLIERGAFAEAVAVLESAEVRFPGNATLRLASARARLLGGDFRTAERLALAFGEDEPHHLDALWLAADAQRQQGRYRAATLSVHRIAARAADDSSTLAKCVEWLLGHGREVEAEKVVKSALGSGLRDSRLSALAGQIALVLGDFGASRAHLLDALDRGVDLNKSFVLQALSMTQRYATLADPDFKRFAEALHGTTLEPLARASILFGQAKLFIDVGDISQAAVPLREANRLCRTIIRWDKGDWLRFVRDRMQAPSPPKQNPSRSDFVPVFIVGLPRSGTSLVADRLSRDPQVRSRGESSWLPFLAERILADARGSERFPAAEAFYRSQMTQDDEPARFYLDKNPVNFRFLDRVAALFPQARVIHCRRNLRDSAMSIYCQYFANPSNGFAFDFSDIAEYAAGATTLMTHWRSRLMLPIYTCDYERLVAEPEAQIAALREFIGLPDADSSTVARSDRGPISTASAWQARQPVYRTSVGRSGAFAAHFPELLEAFPDPEAVA